ncbi:MAG: hypothetical protein JRG89_24960 [Deltaproteobacteria bacterium]|nr:hypothetical protein [Deltaproteobacteria bacterium]
MKSTHPTRDSLAVGLLAGVLLALGPAPAQAAETGALDPALSSASATAGTAASTTTNKTGDEPTTAQKLRAAYWRGRTCTTALCRSPRPGGFAEVASFGLAAFGGVWISRRRSG